MEDEETTVEHTAAAMVAEARSKIVNLSPAQVAREHGEDAVLIDVREEEELHAQGWIADSVWAPRGMLELWADTHGSHHRGEFDRRRRLILYCSSGDRSALATETLLRMGYRNVAHLDGGLHAWRQSGRPVVRP